ncbi:zinc-binding dehydrogenase [Shouchella clausii]|uniref:zinc-binding dehydrogenase n=1 Tax=Shouchella clausii TaxID=79880 RepID=UPI000BA6FFB0|nr:zinc-binding dehydrogenase [Shouchella clausii]MEB5479525.1 zinc-binding dehydrogenase [Shouchella clausii]PAD14548.1 alcohol dehydrogenase [Shouchella clausii]
MIRAVIATPNNKKSFVIQETKAPQPQLWEAIVEVKTFSLNRGEVVDALQRKENSRPGWDFSGTVLHEALNGSGPKKGSRVVGLVPTGAWAEQVAVPTSALAEIPAEITFEQAATLPVAGLSALYALRKGGLLLDKRVLITGSSGGVGLFAHQLAALSGAYSIGVARSNSKAKLVETFGANEILVGEDVTEAIGANGPYDFIIDSVGGNTLAALLPQLVAQGTCVSLGHSSSPNTTLNILGLGGRTLYSFFLGEEINYHAPEQDLAMLAHLVAAGKLQTVIEIRESWNQINTVAHQLIERRFTGKAVLTI